MHIQYKGRNMKLWVIFYVMFSGCTKSKEENRGGSICLRFNGAGVRTAALI